MAKENLAMITIAIPEEAFQFSENFLSFIYQDEMEGVFDLFEMTKNAKTAKRIPTQVRAEYERHYMVAGELLDNMLSELEKKIEKLQIAQASGESEIILDSLDVFADSSGSTITNAIPADEKLIKVLKNSIEKFKQNYSTRPQEIKVLMINSAVEQFVAKCAAEETYNE